MSGYLLNSPYRQVSAVSSVPQLPPLSQYSLVAITGPMFHATSPTQCSGMQSILLVIFEPTVRGSCSKTANHWCYCKEGHTGAQAKYVPRYASSQDWTAVGQRRCTGTWWVAEADLG
jgi:hypothetical protein